MNIPFLSIFNKVQSSFSNRTKLQNKSFKPTYPDPIEWMKYNEKLDKQLKQNIILELVKDYDNGLYVIVEMTKKPIMTYRRNRILDYKNINDTIILTYLTDKTQEPIAWGYYSPHYIDYNGLMTFANNIKCDAGSSTILSGYTYWLGGRKSGTLPIQKSEIDSIDLTNPPPDVGLQAIHY